MAALWQEVALPRDQFIARVWQQGMASYRDLPWRNIDDPYGVLVSEVMLQQTQVVRVLKFWPRFMAAFPTVDALAMAGNADVLELWQGLGYNRRALLLKRAAEVCAREHQGRLPETYEELLSLPGVGPATAAGVCNFALRANAPYLETNVRSVFLHELFPREEGVSDKRLLPFVEDCAATEEPRGWNYALLDYGAQLKAQTVNPSRRSAAYARQSPFVGSNRQKRAALLRCVLGHPEGVAVQRAWQLVDEELGQSGIEPASDEQKHALVAQLVAEGFFSCKGDLLVP